MASFSVLRCVFNELTSRKDAFREPEPRLVMSDPGQVEAFHEAGRADGVMAPIYLFHAIHMSTIIMPGDTVVDLGCGPANQLGLAARLNPDARFVGVDLSDEMLARAERNLREHAIGNVRLQQGDITELKDIASGSADAVISSVALHHLPDKDALYRCFGQVRRVLKPGGGLYIVDFGHLRTEATIHYFAHQYVAQQPELFTIDYQNSLRAAFELSTWRDGWARNLKNCSRLLSTFAAPYMVVIKSPERAKPPRGLTAQFDAVLRRMSANQQRDFRDLTIFFRFGGLKTPHF